MWQEAQSAAARNRARAESDGQQRLEPVPLAAPSADADADAARRASGASADRGGAGACSVGGGAEGAAADGGDRWGQRRRRLEEDNARRAAEIADFQRQHWREMRAAAARNKAAVLGQLLGAPEGDEAGAEAAQGGAAAAL